MKLFLVTVALLAACSRSNDVSSLHREALAVANFYQPQVDALDRRVQQIFKRGTTIPANLPGIEEVGKRLTEARDTIVQLRGIVGKGPDGKSAVEKQADLAVKDHKVDDLEKLIDDTQSTLDRGTLIVNDDLGAVESWIALYDQGINRVTTDKSGAQDAVPQPAPQVPTAAPGPTPTANANQPTAPATPPGPARETAKGSAAPHR